MTQGYRISPKQRHLHLHQPGSAYLTQGHYVVEGSLDPQRLKRAITGVFAAVDVLHSELRQVEGMTAPLMTPRTQAAFDLRVEDLGVDHSQIDDLFQDLRQRGVAADDTTPHRFIMLREAQRTHLIAALPALVCDARGLDNLITEVGRAYAAEASELDADEFVQYAVVAEWLNELADEPDAAAARDYWRGFANHDLMAYKLPFQYRSFQARPFQPAVRERRLDAQSVARMDQLTGDAGLEAAGAVVWRSVLTRLTGGEEVLLGRSAGGRDDEDLAGAIGLFEHCVPLWFASQDSFARTLEVAGEHLREGGEYQDVFRWELLLGRPEQQGEVSFFPFGYTYREIGDLPFGDLSCQTRLSRSYTDRFDMALELRRDTEGVVAEIHYDRHHFPVEGVDLLLDQFATLFTNAAAQPDQNLSELSTLSDEHRRRQLIMFNDHDKDFPVGTLHGFVEQQAAQTPDAPAIIFEQRTWTYAQLNHAANALARRIAQSAKPGSLVGVAVGRSPEMIAALLAILKASCAYVPLDPGYPADRLAFMLQDAGAALLVTQPQLRDLLPDFTGETLFVETQDTFEIATNLDLPIGPENAAYVIYTSGSTGKPKGVLMHHRGICNRIRWIVDLYPMGAGKRMFVKTPYSFDASIWEMFGPLWCGGALVLAKPDGHKDAAYMVDMIVDAQITHTQMVPSLLEALLEAGRVNPRQNEHLERVFCGGEKLSSSLQDRYFTYMNAGLTNLYGPTEIAIDAASWRCEPKSPMWEVPIGPPIANAKLYMVDVAMNPVAIGEPGELLVGGPGPAIGYFGRPAATAEKFIPDPFGEQPGARLYKTGDLARWLPQGAVDYVGRADFQVKLRGFRIELGEIEALLADHDSVRANLVVLREDHPGDQKLVAYILPSDGYDETTLQDYLNEYLPEFMVPSVFMTLDDWPRTPSGKIDRGRLPQPEIAVATFVAPRNETETTLAAIWRDVIHVDQIGVHDNFFDLGGHSLMAMQLVSRIREQTQIDISIQQIFATPTLAELAGVIDGADDDMDEMEF